MGTLAQDYDIIRELGRGGMGTVYLARDKNLDREVAIKMLQNVSSDENDEGVKRFKKEGSAVAKLHHPNIVNIYSTGKENNKYYYMIIEYVDGNTLDKNTISKETQLSIEEILDIGIQVCKALSYTHKHNIIHRDVKPANIIYAKDKTAKLMDFGIACFANEKTRLTKEGTILGSVLYIPPEQLISSKDVDQRADLYSLGVTLFELITLNLPYEGSNVGQVVSNIITKEPANVKTFVPTIPKTLETLITKAISKNPALRFQTADSFLYALEEVLKSIKKGEHKIETSLSESLDKVTLDIQNSPQPVREKTKPLKPAIKTDKLETNVLNIKTKKNNSKLKYIASIILLSIISLTSFILWKKDKKTFTPVQSNSPIESVIQPQPLPTKVPVPLKSAPVKVIHKAVPIIKKQTSKKLSKPVKSVEIKPHTEIKHIKVKPKTTVKTTDVGEGY